MRILNLEAPYFVSCLRKMGHTVLSVGSRGGCDICLSEPLAGDGLVHLLRQHSFRPDLVLWADSCQPPSVLGFEMLPCPAIGFSIDQYCNPWHVPWSFCFDAFLVAQKDYLPLFPSAHAPRVVEWFPLFFKIAGRPPEPATRDIPVAFVGTVGATINTERQAFLTAVGKGVPLLARSGDFVPIYGRSQIVLNQSAAGEINFRFFEGPGCGALLVTERTENGLEELLVPQEEVALYERGNALDAIRVCRELLDAPERTREMARAGQRRVLREHCLVARARHIVRLGEQLCQNKAWQWRTSNRNFVARELAKVFAFLGSDSLLPLPPELAKAYLRLGARMAERTSQD